MYEAINFSDVLHLLYIGLFLVAVWTSAFIISGAYSVVWNWIDDNENPISSPLNSYIRKMFGWEEYSGIWNYWRKEDGIIPDKFSDEPCLWYWSAGSLLLLVFPFAVFKFTSITISLVIAYVVAVSARYMRRGLKMFKKHVEDKAIHSKSEN